MRRTRTWIWGFWILMMGVGMPSYAVAATGCSLNNPEEDLYRFFDPFSDFTIRYTTFANQNPQGYNLLAKRMGEELDPVYETDDVPYTLYTVFNNGERIGYVFGANQRGKYSNIQIIAGTDISGNLKRVHIQKIRSPRASAFLSPDFLSALAETSFSTYPSWEKCYRGNQCDEVGIPDPTNGAENEDYRAILRGLAKLFHVRELLLKPGVVEPPVTGHARAEQLSLHWVPEQGFRPLLQPPRKAVSETSLDELPPDEPVAVVVTDNEVRLYPVSLLTLHPVVEDTIDNTDFSITWSSPTFTLSVLRVTQNAPWRFSNSNSVMFGHQTLIERSSRKDWCAIAGSPINNEQNSDQLEYHAAAWTMPWKLAKRYFPHASLAYTSDSYSKHNVFYQAHHKRFHNPLQQQRVLVIDTGNFHWVIPKHHLERKGIYVLEGKLESIVVIAESQWFAAYRLPPHIAPGDIEWLGNDLPRGFPLIHSRKHRVTWQSISGIPVSGNLNTSALTPVLLREMPQFTARAFYPEEDQGISWAAPQPLASPEEFGNRPPR